MQVFLLPSNIAGTHWCFLYDVTEALTTILQTSEHGEMF